MENIKEKARQIYEDWNGHQSGDEFLAPMIEFARQMCELQKRDCAQNALIEAENRDYSYDNEGVPIFTTISETIHMENIVIYPNKQSILDTPNVCEL